MDPEAIDSLPRRFWYRLAAVLLVGAALLAGGIWLAGPGSNAFLAALHGGLALLFVGFGAVTLRLGNRVDAAGQAVAAVGWLVWVVSALRDYPDALFWAGLVLIFAGATVGLASDLRGRFGGLASG